jgi:transposase
MARRERTAQPLPTIWPVPDPLWERIEPVLNELDPPAKTGRKRIAPRPASEGIIYEMRTGRQWNVLPRSCWPRPSRRLWSSGPNQPPRSPRTCLWTKDTTIPRAGGRETPLSASHPTDRRREMGPHEKQTLPGESLGRRKGPRWL